MRFTLRKSCHCIERKRGEIMIVLTKRQARQFMLLKHGLLGTHRFTGKQGALDFIRQAGCIQFDPIDICGKNPEITLQSRVKNFAKGMLRELLYEDRALFDYPDKQLSIIPIEYWMNFERLRAEARVMLKRHPEIEEHIEIVRKYIEANGAVNSDDFTLEGKTSWWSAINWSSGGKLSRSVLEQMYSSGDLIIHHKKGARRYYDLAEKHIPSDILHAPDPLPDDFDYVKWLVLRRIGAVGLLWNRSSGAFINIWYLTSDIRKKVFDTLISEEEVITISVEGLKDKAYCRKEDIALIEEVLEEPQPDTTRCELIAPLDPIMWDRKLIKAIFDYEYTWEIYTPAIKRRYGAYVLPLLSGDRFIGRVEAICKRESTTLEVKNIWYEDDVKRTKKLDSSIDDCIKRFALFNNCSTVQRN